jgi:hypothetical protein
MRRTYRYMSSHVGDGAKGKARTRVGLRSGVADHEVDEVIAWLRPQGMRWEQIHQMDPGELERVLDRLR